MPSADPAQRLHDIIENIGLVEAYTAGMTETGFLNDGKVQDAVQYCLLRISEASVKLGPLVQSRRPEIRWRELRGL